MSVSKQLLVAAIAAAAGISVLLVAWLVVLAVGGSSDLGYREVGVGTLAYATGYVLAVPRAERWVASMGDKHVTA